MCLPSAKNLSLLTNLSRPTEYVLLWIKWHMTHQKRGVTLCSPQKKKWVCSIFRSLAIGSWIEHGFTKIRLSETQSWEKQVLVMETLGSRNHCVAFYFWPQCIIYTLVHVIHVVFKENKNKHLSQTQTVQWTVHRKTSVYKQ